MSYNTTENPAGRRIAALLDAGSFAEIGGEITARNTDFNLQEKKTPSDGVVTGYGLIDGNLVYVYSQDPNVLNGSMGEMHARKITNIYDMAMKMGAPVIGLIDCAGFRLQESTDALDAFGNLYRKQTEASGVVPQITAIFGMCGGGLAIRLHTAILMKGPFAFEMSSTISVVFPITLQMWFTNAGLRPSITEVSSLESRISKFGVFLISVIMR